MKPHHFACFLLLFLPACGTAAAGPKPKSIAEPDPLNSKGAAWFELRGREAQRQGDTVRAEQYFSAALKRGGKKTRLLKSLLEVTVAGSRLRAALNYAEPELQLNPGDTNLALLVVSLRIALEQFDQAHRELTRLVHQHPHQGEAHYLLGMLEADHYGNHAAARRHLSRYLQIAPRGRHAAEVRARLSDPTVDLLTLRQSGGLP